MTLRSDIPTEEVIGQLFALVDRLRGEFDAVVGQFDLSVPQARALRYLERTGPAPMRELACGLRCDASNVTGIVHRLEQRGLVERTLGPADRRVRSVALTPRGADLARTFWGHMIDASATLAGLSVDDTMALLQLLRRVAGSPDGSSDRSRGESSHGSSDRSLGGC